MFLIDASGSIGDAAFEDARRFLVSVIDGFDISNQKTRVGVIDFFHGVSIEWQISEAATALLFTEEGSLIYARETKLITKFSGDKAALVKAVQDMPYMDGMTATGDALRMATQEFIHRARDPGEGFPLVAVLVTDGQPNWSNGTDADPQDALDAAEVLKNAGVTLFTVGITNARIDNLRATG